MQERPLPSDEDVERIVSERIITLLEARLRNRDKLQVERMQRFLPLVHSLGESDEEAALLAMLLDDFYQETFHAPLIPREPGRDTSAPPRAKAGAPRKTMPRPHGAHGRNRRAR